MRFLVIGAHALAALGRPRYTEDLDVWVEPTKTNAQRLARALRDFGYQELAVEAATHFAEVERMATLGRAPIAIDILTSTPGVTFAAAWKGRAVMAIEGKRIGFLGLAEFVRTKRTKGRTKDLLDIELLREAGLWPKPRTSQLRKRKASGTKRARGSKKGA